MIGLACAIMAVYPVPRSGPDETHRLADRGCRRRLLCIEPEVGTVPQGETVENTINNICEAVELYLEEFPMLQTTDRNAKDQQHVKLKRVRPLWPC